MPLRLPAAIAAVFIAAGCISVLPEPQAPDGLYRIGPVADASVSLPVSLVVREPIAPRVLAGRSIVAEDENGALTLVSGAEWADAPTRMLQFALIDLFAVEPGGPLATSPQAGARGAVELSWRVSDFSLRGRMARCRLELTLLNGASRAPIARRTVQTEFLAAGDSANARATALRAAALSALDQSARFVSEQSAASAIEG